jgi:hypothetical protein
MELGRLLPVGRDLPRFVADFGKLIKYSEADASS